MPTIFLLAFLLIAYLVQRWSVANALKGVDFYYEASLLMAAPGERFELLTTVSNHSWRFIPYVSMAESIPKLAKIHALGAMISEGDVGGEAKHVSKVYLMPRSRLIRRATVSISARGRYIFPGAMLRGGDFLGFGENSENAKYFEQFNEVVVYPEITAGDFVDKVMGEFLGDLSVRRFIIEDPILTVGFLEYTGRESMKSISWTQSARSGQLMVKSYDYTTELSVSIVLDIETVASAKTDKLIESCFSICHQVCRGLKNKNIMYDFFSNISVYGSAKNWDYIGEKSGELQLRTILEGLGRASYNSYEPLNELLDRVLRKQQGRERSIIFIVPEHKDEATIRNKGRGEGRDLIICAEALNFANQA